ncbi:DUF5403 family protein [Microbacterium trichothecenolyticum]|uniref:Uncharacterized protein n=1 Tax=Microbacterium trichothecenolyticum TaxID=69370 RepID=A0A0M2H5V1_MICTR|nr:DUF5403 family protein [Microbacterium trichothecenolyticum]KJL39910.1 hypothetical protein RS82_04123 [Microbacterium trichothecenolyticum]
MASRVWLRSRNRVTVAQMCGEDAVMGQAAGRVLRSVRTVAAQHVDTGNYMRKLGTVKVPGEKGTGRSVMDRLVVADDPAAASIEWGHFTTRITRAEGSRRVTTGPLTWVPGKHIMAKGLARVKSLD